MENFTLSIEEYGPKGEGIAHLEEKSSTTKVSIPHTVIGDTISANLTKKRRGQRKGRVENILTPSTNRVAPRCKHATLCGGCCWQQIDYQQQLKEKESQILQYFSQISSPTFTFHPIIGSSDPWFYRNKMEFSFSENRAGTKFLGLMIAGANRYVFNVEECFLGGVWFADLLNIVRSWWEDHPHIKAYDYSNGSGLLRALTLREGKHTNHMMVMLTISGNQNISEDDIVDFQKRVAQFFSNEENECSIYLQKVFIEKKKRTQIEKIHLFGRKEIQEDILLQVGKQKKVHLSFSISPDSFFQPNTLQAEKVYARAIELANIQKECCTVYDLYCGTGTLGMAFSPFAKNVIGIELNEQAVIDARKNAEKNKITNYTIHCGDVGKTLQSLNMDKEPDLVIVDPPRAGLDDRAIDQILSLKPKKIVYISCNPKTQAEDVKKLLPHYELSDLQPIDQFFHTYHVENIAILQRID